MESIEDIFPNLAAQGYTQTIAPTDEYNCIAHAADDDGRWWDPSESYYWPSQANRDFTVDALMSAYATLGYSRCNDGSIENGFEKIAIYADADEYMHAAKQLENGKWSSKLGQLEDIEHETLLALEGESYGSVAVYMKRHRR